MRDPDEPVRNKGVASISSSGKIGPLRIVGTSVTSLRKCVCVCFLNKPIFVFQMGRSVILLFPNEIVVICQYRFN